MAEGAVLAITLVVAGVGLTAELAVAVIVEEAVEPVVGAVVAGVCAPPACYLGFS